MCKRLVCLLCCALVWGHAQSALGADPNLVGLWNCDEGGGTVAYDSSGKGNDGTFNGNPQWVAGYHDGALAFGGASDFLDCGNDPSLDLTQWTIAFWLNVNENKNYNGFVIKGLDAAENFEVLGFADGNFHFPITFDDGTRTFANSPTGVIVVGEWAHFAYSYDTAEGRRLYKDGGLIFEDAASGTPQASTDPLLIGNEGGTSRFVNGIMDDIAIFSYAMSEAEINAIMQGFAPGEIASNPSPKDEIVDVLRDTLLNWSPGEYAAQHDVYVGTNYDDVNSATPADAAYMGRQAETVYAPEALTLGATYFWRVDEVNAAPDNTVFKGDIWSFEVEPVSNPVPIGTVSATASSADGAADPNNVVNGFGLNENDEHAVALETMWSGADTDMTPSIEFTFDKLLKLDKVHVWNHNSQTESILGFGFKEALIEYSADGATWSELGTVEIPQATGTPAYTGADVALGGIMATTVKITGLSNHSILGLPQKGLAEVRFYAIPVQAREPMPADGSMIADADVILGWRSGREAVEHEVVFSTDEQAVIDGSAVVATVSEPSHDLDTLTLATSYFWKINEMNDAGTPPAYEGDIWSFQTPEYLVIDDMEMYKATEGLFIWEHWVDGFDNPAENGAVVGNGDEAETTIVHGGSQSLPITYNNNTAAVSEATLQIDEQDWLASGGKTLALYFHGAAGNTGQLYVKVNDAQIDYSGDADDLTQGPWHTWNIDLSTVGGDMSKVTSLTIGVSGGGATGKLYIDDIRLYPVLGEMITPVEPDAASLLVHYTFDGDFSDSAGNNDGTALGDAKIVNDPERGQVVSLDGDDDAVSVPLLPAGTEVTISMWVNPLDAVTPSDMKSTYVGDGWTEGDIHWRIANNRIDGGISGLADGSNMTGAGVVPYEQWSLVVLTFTPTEFSYWLNGLHDITRLLETGPTLQLGEGLIGGWMNGELIEREWAGTIDDVRIYNRALSEGEVLWLAGKTAPVDKPL